MKVRDHPDRASTRGMGVAEEGFGAKTLAAALVYDPRDAQQQIYDPATWKESANEALLLADADRRSGLIVRWPDVATLADIWDAHNR